VKRVALGRAATRLVQDERGIEGKEATARPPQDWAGEGRRARWAARGRKGKGRVFGGGGVFYFPFFALISTQKYFLAKSLNHKQKNMVRHDATTIMLTPRVYLHKISS
jgi:hypothetical protein